MAWMIVPAGVLVIKQIYIINKEKPWENQRRLSGKTTASSDEKTEGPLWIFPRNLLPYFFRKNIRMGTPVKSNCSRN